MKNDSCPSVQQLNGFARGALPDVEADQLVSHLDACPSCEETMHGLDSATDPFLSALRRPIAEAEQSFLQEAEFHEAIATIGGLSAATRQSKDDPSAKLDPAANDAVHVGDLIRDYELLDILGRGGMGVVYRARHVKLDRVVAVKVLSKKALHHESMVERFEREMQAVGKLDHPNIVRAHDAGEVDGLHYLVMEYVDGANLSALLKACNPLSVADACELVRQAAIGLQDVHKHGLVHRDLKPANLMLTEAGTVKILDLGLARLHENPLSASDLTSTGQLMGTIDYMSPEQAENTHDVDIRADIYSLGATLHALLTGQAPFVGAGHVSAMKKLVALSNELPPRIDSLRDDVPAELADMVETMLAKQPQDRPRTPQQIADALTPFAADHNAGQLITDFASIRASHDVGSQATKSSLVVNSAFAETDIADTAGAIGSRPVARSARPHTAAHSESAGSGAVGKAERLPTSFRWVRSAVITAIAMLLLLYSGQMIRIATGKGVLMIESNSESIEVTILKGDSKNAVAIVDRETGREYTLDISDDYRVIVTEAESGIELCSERVTITRGGSRVLDVTAESQAAATMATTGQDDGNLTKAEDTASDRLSAEAAFQIGADRVWIQRSGTDVPVEITDASDLPTVPFQLHGFAVTLQHELTAAEISRFMECKHLKTVLFDAPGVRFSNASVKAISELPHLEVLGLTGSLVTGSQLQIISEHATTLQSLTLTGCRNIDDSALSAISELTVLRDLNLNSVDLTDIGLHSIGFMQSLRTLRVRQTSVGLETVEDMAAALPNCTIESDFGRYVPLSVSGALAADETPYTERENVEWAFQHGASSITVLTKDTQQQVNSVQEIPDTPFTMIGGIWDLKKPVPADELPRLASLKHMGGSYFNVHGFNVGDDFISALLAWRQMEQLGLLMGDVTHEQIGRVVRHFPDMADLSLAHSTGVDEEMLSIIASHDQLTTLELQETAVTDAALRSLHNMKSLTSLDVSETRVTPTGIEELSDALPNCRIKSDLGIAGPRDK